MDQEEFGRVAASFAAFHAQFAPLFGRKEARRRSEQYVRGLLVQQTDRRNAENVAEMIEGATPRTLQRLLTEAPWARWATASSASSWPTSRRADTPWWTNGSTCRPPGATTQRAAAPRGCRR